MSGTRVDGQTLSADDGTWTGTQPILFTYQWQRCDAAGDTCADIAGRDRLDLHAGDRRHRPRRPRRRHRRQRRRRRLGRQPRSPSRSRPRRRVNMVAPTDHRHRRCDGQTLTAARRHVDRLAADHPDLPVAALRRRRRRTAPTSPARPTRRYTLADDDVGHTMRVEVTAPTPPAATPRHSAPSAASSRAPAGQHRRPVDLRHAARRPGADARRRRLDRHAGARPSLPVAALRRRRQRLRRHRRRDRPRPTRSTGADVGHTVRAVVTVTNARGERRRAPPTRARSSPRAPPVNTIAPAVTGTAATARPSAPTRARWTGTGHGRLHLPVAALRRRRHRLRRHRRRHRRGPTR